MVYKEDFIYNIYCGTHVIKGVTDNIFRLQGTRMPWFNSRLGPEKRKKHTSYKCIICLICNIYCIYLICILYILYIAYICRVKSEWYINRTSFTTFIGEPSLPMVLRMTSSGYKVRGCPGSKPGCVWKKEKKKTYYTCIIYLICNIYCI